MSIFHGPHQYLAPMLCGGQTKKTSICTFKRRETKIYTNWNMRCNLNTQYFLKAERYLLCAHSKDRRTGSFKSSIPTLISPHQKYIWTNYQTRWISQLTNWFMKIINSNPWCVLFAKNKKPNTATEICY